MKTNTLLLVMLLMLQLVACSQNVNKNNAKKSSKQVGGGCEGCEAIYESPIAFEKLNAIDTLPDFNEQGPKIEISGTVYQVDGKTPAAGVIIYVYHTDQQGYYSKGTGSTWGRRHGYIRGWIKTGKNGYYKFYTLKPAAYPGRKDPAHIHVTVKEPDVSEYWIDEYLFDDDPLLTKEQRNKAEDRAGSGIIKLVMENGMLKATRDIILGKNVPGY